MPSQTSVFRNLVNGIRAVNHRYRTPKIEMTPMVRFCLVALRVYLVVLVGLLVFKFVLAARG